MELREENSVRFLSIMDGRRGSGELIMNLRLWHGTVRARPRRCKSKNRLSTRPRRAGKTQFLVLVGLPDLYLDLGSQFCLYFQTLKCEIPLLRRN